MNKLPSAEFRRTYAKLTEPTEVTVNGHTIGIWVVRVASMTAEEAAGAFQRLPEREPMAQVAAPITERFNTQPFRGPIPKVRK